jgi:uncharacterized protein (TIGR02246 family)
MDFDGAREAVAAFVAGLQAGHDRRDAAILNQQFASDVAWGSPYGALIEGYGQLHPIHVQLQQKKVGGPSFRYELRHLLGVSDGVVVAHIARLALDATGEPLEPSSDARAPFSEMAMYVLVKRAGAWWLAAAQHTPMRPGGVTAATTS